MSKYVTQRELEILTKAASLGMEQALTDYALTIQKEFSMDGDEALWIDCLEMAYNELIINRLPG